MINTTFSQLLCQNTHTHTHTHTAEEQMWQNVSNLVKWGEGYIGSHCIILSTSLWVGNFKIKKERGE